MIEDIKKEIEEKTQYFDNKYYDLYNEFCNCAGSEYPNNGRIPIITINTLFEILDKYKDKEDKYKNAWEELKKISQNDDCGEKTAHDFLWFLEQTMQELEQKNGIEVK